MILVGPPHAVYTTVSGKRYVADDTGLIQVISVNDISDLIDAGAIVTGNALLIIQGTATNSNASDGGMLQLCCSANAGEISPSGGQQAVGTPLGQALTFGVTMGAVNKIPFQISGYATGMTLGQSYWYDLAITGVAGGAASISGVTTIAIEL